MRWVEDFSQAQVRLVGVLEMPGAAGRFPPALTGGLPWLTPLAVSPRPRYQAA